VTTKQLCLWDYEVQEVQDALLELRRMLTDAGHGPDSEPFDSVARALSILEYNEEDGEVDSE
jgi:hypothetical protein